MSPDIVVVLDHLILNEVDVTAGLKPGGLLVINSPNAIEKHKLPDYRVAVANVTKLGIEAGLRKGVVNSGIIGVLSKASGLVDIDLLADCITKEFYNRRPEENAKSARLAFEATQTQGGANA